MLNPIFFSIIIFFVVITFCFLTYFIVQKFLARKSQSQRINQVVNYSGPTGITSESKSQQNTAKVNITDSKKDKPQEQQGTGSLRRDSRISAIPIVNKLLSTVFSDRVASLKILIEQTGLKIKAGEFLLFVICIGLIGMILVNLTLKIPFVGAVVVILPFFVLNILKQKRLEAFIQQMPQALDALQGDLRAGLDVQAAIKHVADEFPAPIGEEFAKINVEVGLGLSLNDALNNLVKRVNTMDVQILATGIIINRELGGNLGELVKSVAETIKERFKLQGMIRSLTAESSGSAYLLMGLPVGLFFLLNGMAPDTYHSFMTDPMGKGAMYGCIGSMLIGFIIIKQITKLEV